MKSDLQFSPGNSLSSFLSIVSVDLKWRQVEYLTIAFFDKNEFPIAMRQIAGRTSWVACSIESIITDAKELNASGICLVHNHPASYDEKPYLKPSPEDISFQKHFLNACQTNSLTYLGSWISSKGQLNEILYHVWQEAIRTKYTYPENELQKVNYALTLTFVSTVQSLTKSIIIVCDEYNMGQLNNFDDGCNKTFILNATAKNSYPLNDTSTVLFQLELSIASSHSQGGITSKDIEFLSYEELNRACYALPELYEESKRLSLNVVEPQG